MAKVPRPKTWKPYARAPGVVARQLHLATSLDTPEGIQTGVAGDFLVGFPPTSEDAPWAYHIWPKEAFKRQFQLVKGGKVSQRVVKTVRAQLKLILAEKQTGGPDA